MHSLRSYSHAGMERTPTSSFSYTLHHGLLPHLRSRVDLSAESLANNSLLLCTRLSLIGKQCIVCAAHLAPHYCVVGQSFIGMCSSVSNKLCLRGSIFYRTTSGNDHPPLSTVPSILDHTLESFGCLSSKSSTAQWGLVFYFNALPIGINLG